VAPGRDPRGPRGPRAHGPGGGGRPPPAGRRQPGDRGARLPRGLHRLAGGAGLEGGRQPADRGAGRPGVAAGGRRHEVDPRRPAPRLHRGAARPRRARPAGRLEGAARLGGLLPGRAPRRALRAPLRRGSAGGRPPAGAGRSRPPAGRDPAGGPGPARPRRAPHAAGGRVAGAGALAPRWPERSPASGALGPRAPLAGFLWPWGGGEAERIESPAPPMPEPVDPRAAEAAVPAGEESGRSAPAWRRRWLRGGSR